MPLIPNRISLSSTIIWALKSRIRSLLSLLNIKKRITLRRIWSGIEKKSERDVVIIAGGPSFTPELADAIAENKDFLDVVAINFYCLNKISEVLVPDYYVLSDPAHLDVASLDPSPNNIKLLDYFKRKKITLCAPYGKGWSIYSWPYLMYDDTEDLFSRNISPCYPRGFPSNTMFKAIALMLEIGYRRIYLVGFDYDYPRKILLNKDNRLLLVDEHHYSVKHSDYSIYFDSVGHALHWWSQDYWYIRKLSSPRVINVTETSMIDAFTRIRPNSFDSHVSFQQNK